MGIVFDAGELLYWLYLRWMEDNANSISLSTLMTITKWDADRIAKAMYYLNRKGAIEFTELTATDGQSQTSHTYAFSFTDKGIDIIEFQFEEVFKFVLIKFSWEK